MASGGLPHREAVKDAGILAGPRRPPVVKLLHSSFAALRPLRGDNGVPTWLFASMGFAT
jgi:hypothetical protein